MEKIELPCIITPIEYQVITKFFQKSFIKIWSIQKKVVTLHRLKKKTYTKTYCTLVLTIKKQKHYENNSKKISRTNRKKLF